MLRILNDRKTITDGNTIFIIIRLTIFVKVSINILLYGLPPYIDANRENGRSLSSDGFSHFSRANCGGLTVAGSICAVFISYMIIEHARIAYRLIF